MLAVPALLLALLAAPGDSLLRIADALLARGEAWHATRAVAPLLERPETRSPEAVLLAARAAAGWEGWSTVSRLLTGQPWLDRADGAGRALLAHAAVERADPSALALAHRAVRAGLPDMEHGARLLTLARALDRAGMLDSAAATYRRAATLLPQVADWLHLRAAGVLADSAGRAALYATITGPAAQARIPWTEALVLERTGDPARATVAYRAVGRTLASLRLRLVVSDSGAKRRAIRRELVAFLEQEASGADVGDAIALLDGSFAPLAAQEHLVVARRASAAGLLERAHRGFAAAGTLGDADRHAHGTVLFRLGRYDEAINRFEGVRSSTLRPDAMYQRARSLFRLRQGPRAVEALRLVGDSFPSHAASASSAGYLLGDWYVDVGDDTSARREFLATGRRHPGTSQGDRAAFQAAMIAWVRRDHRAAAAEFDALADRNAAASEGTAAMYWSGRAWEALGDSARARARWQAILQRFPQSYYVVPAGRRLGSVQPFAWRGNPGTLSSTTDSAAQHTIRRAALLEQLGMRVESRFELEGLQRDGSDAGSVATAHALAEAGHLSLALQHASRAIGQGVSGAGLAPLMYPLLDRTALEREARLVGLDPFLVAGLIRQESLYDPAARSRADARGLMQVMPSVGAAAARAEGYPEWDTVLLYQPDVNMHIGLQHLAERWERCGGSVEAALAAYNAGSTPVNRWLRRAGTTDPEVFIERIPYVETRDYVRRVLFNQARYTAIYAPDTAASPVASDSSHGQPPRLGQDVPR